MKFQPALGLALAGVGLLASTGAFAQCATLPGAWGASSVIGTPADGLSATTASAMRSTTCGLEVRSNPRPNRRFVQDDTPANELRYRARYFIDPNSVAFPIVGLERRSTVLRVQTTSNSTPLGPQPVGFVDQIVMKLERSETGYRLVGFARVGNGTLDNQSPVADVFRWTQASVNGVALLDAPNVVELEYVLGATGSFKLWVNANVEGTPTISTAARDNASWAGVDQVRLGNVGAGTNLSVALAPYYVDEFESRRQTFIGN